MKNLSFEILLIMINCVRYKKYGLLYRAKSSQISECATRISFRHLSTKEMNSVKSLWALMQ